MTVQTLFDVGTLRTGLEEHIDYRPGLPWLVRGNVHLLKLLSPRMAYRWIVQRRYDVAVAFLEGAVTRIVSGCPYPDSKLVAWVHGEQLSAKAAAYCYRNEEEWIRCNQAFHRIVCVAESVKRDLLHILPSVDPHKVDVCYNVNDVEAIRLKCKVSADEAIIHRDGFNLVSVGTLNEVKGFDRLILAHRKLKDKGIRTYLYIIGEGDCLQALQKLAESLGVTDTVHLLGHKDNPYPYMAKADLYVCASHQEGFSTAVTEALVLGIPVVSTDCSGARELLGNSNEYGIVTENSTEGILDGLTQMLESPEVLASYKIQAIKRGNDFSKEKAVAAVEKLIDNL